MHSLPMEHRMRDAVHRMRDAVRPELPEMPVRMRTRPIDARGYPVPFFVAWIDGVPDFRVTDGRKLAACVNRRLCWLCGEQLGRYGVFVLGPMCALNRTTSEPPCHRDCAIYAARACPFLTRPDAKRRAANLPEDHQEPAGIGLKRNPGVALVWVTREWSLMSAEGHGSQPGVLFQVGDPLETLWFAEGRGATREECEHSIETGLPLLLAHDGTLTPAELEDGVQYVAQQLEQTWHLMPGNPPFYRSALDVVRAAMVSTEGAP